MLITKFNRLVRNKWAWTAFAIFVSLAFLVGFGPRSGGCTRAALREDRKAGAQGKLFDRNVTRDEFMNARFFAMGLRENMPLTGKARERLHNRTWQRIAALRTAEQMGIHTSPDEVAEAIRRDSNFQVNGAFSRERYRAAIESQLRVNLQTFESYILQELTIQKLVGMLESIFLTAPLELQRRLGNLTDTFTIEYAPLTNDVHQVQAGVTPADAERFYDDNKKLFAEPAKVSVAYVSFPITNYLADVQVPETEMKDYYDENEEEFLAGDTNTPAARLPFEEVTNAIAIKLRGRMAAMRAKDAAAEFMKTLIPDRTGKAPRFDEAAAKWDQSGLSVSTSDFFTATGKALGTETNREFNKAAFDLDPTDPARNFSDPVVGKDAVYVLAIKEKLPSRIPDFADVKEKAMELARRDAQEKAFLTKCRDIRRSVKKDVQGGKSFTQAAAAQGLNVTTTESFSVYGGLTNEAAYSEELVAGAMYLSKGEVSDLLPVTNGVLLAYVNDRQPGDPATMLLLRPQLQSLVDRYNVAVLLHDWESYLLTKGGLEDYAPVKAEEEEKASSSEEEAPPANPIEP